MKGDYTQAEVVLSQGVNLFAHPVERMEKLLLKCEIPEHDLEQSASSHHDRSVLGQLTSHRAR